jgi:Uma2 family endonuclease
VVNRLSTWLTNHVWDHDLGEVFGAAVDVRLSPHNIVQPDICFISRPRLGIEREQYVDGAPDLVIEVLSERTRGVDLVRKRALYEMAGVPEYWIVDLRNRTITVLTLVDGEYQGVAQSEGVVRSLVVPGFEVVIADVFALR